MRTNVTFKHPAEFVGNEEDGGGVLDVSGASWFAELLKQVPALQVNEEFCQEDWGVVVFARRNQKRFWIGLSAWDSEGTWIAHFHHDSFAWFQRFSSSGKAELESLLKDFQTVLASDPNFSKITWS